MVYGKRNLFSNHYHMKQYMVKIVIILPYNIYSGYILPTPGRDQQLAIFTLISFQLSQFKNRNWCHLAVISILKLITSFYQNSTGNDDETYFAEE